MTDNNFKKFDTGANKDIKGKLRVDLVTPEMIEGLAEVLGYGATKYEQRNWEKGIPYTQSVGAAMRHLLQFLKGVDIDEESGLHHIDQAFLNLGMVVTQERRGRDDLDDRNISEHRKINLTYNEWNNFIDSTSRAIDPFVNEDYCSCDYCPKRRST